MKSGNLNFLEPSGPLQACNGTALPLPLPVPFNWAVSMNHFWCRLTHTFFRHLYDPIHKYSETLVTTEQKTSACYIYIYFFFPMPPHVLLGICGPPSPSCGCSVTDFWGLDAQGARLRRPDDDGRVMDESVVPGGVLNPISTNYPDHGHRGVFLFKEKRTRYRPQSNPGPHG
jgi:hypothetical protein